MSFDSFMQNGIRAGSLFGTDIILRPSFFLVPVLTLLFGWNPLVILAVFGFCLMHEFAHIGAGRLFGAWTRKVEVFIFGMAAHVGMNVRSPLKNLIIYVAGPASNFAMAALLAFFYNQYPSAILKHMISVNVVLGIFNLIPIFPMDGAGIMNCLLRMVKTRSMLINDIMFIVTSIAALAVIYFGFKFGAFMAAGIAIFLWMNAYPRWQQKALYLDHLD